MTVAPCTCGGIAPGYPMHEDFCATVIGDRQARDEAAAPHHRPCDANCTDPWCAHPDRAA